MISSYLESNSNMKEPLMPGSIIAIIAIEPVRKIKTSLFGKDVVLDRDMVTAINIPKSIKNMDLML